MRTWSGSFFENGFEDQDPFDFEGHEYFGDEEEEKETLKVLILDSNPGNLAAAEEENRGRYMRGYEFITAATTSEAFLLLGAMKFFAVIVDSKQTDVCQGLTVALHAHKLCVPSIVYIKEDGEWDTAEYQVFEELLDSLGIFFISSTGNMGGVCWSPRAGKLIRGDYTYSKGESPVWKPDDGCSYEDLEDVRSWTGVLASTPREEGLDMFPGFPRDGDYELALAYRDSIS